MYLRLNRPLHLKYLDIDEDFDLFKYEGSEEDLKGIVEELNISLNKTVYKILLFHHFKLMLDEQEVELLIDSFDNNEIEVFDLFVKHLIDNEYKLLINKN